MSEYAGRPVRYFVFDKSCLEDHEALRVLSKKLESLGEVAVFDDRALSPEERVDRLFKILANGSQVAGYWSQDIAVRLARLAKFSACHVGVDPIDVTSVFYSEHHYWGLYAQGQGSEP